MSSITTALDMLLKPKHASGHDLVPRYEQVFAHTMFGKELPTLAFSRGRVALWTILKAAGVDSTSEVILPAYTCETVPMAVKFTGAKCVYVDNAPNTYNVPLSNVNQAITPNSRAIICQHTYGMMQPVQKWNTLAEEKGILLVEDRCQLVKDISTSYPEPLRSTAAYYSTHFSKPYSTAQGGMAVFSDNQLYAEARMERSNFRSNGDYHRARNLALQVLLYSITVWPATRAIVGSMYRRAQRSGMIRGTISSDEYGKDMPVEYLSGVTNLQATLGIEQLGHWNQYYRHRQNLTRFYIEQLASLGVDVSPLRSGNNNPALLMVPVLVNNKKELLKRAATKALPIGTWFDRFPAHICNESMDLYDYRQGQCPCTEKMISKEIHLLTASWVNDKSAGRAVEFIKRYADLSN
jgi:dTDP-4-amino-4,6-dideoxygalactose transaminase